MRHVVDNREKDRGEIPERCPMCYADIEVTDLSGTWYVSGPADIAAANRQYDFEVREGDVVEHHGLNAHCPNDDWQWLAVYGPAAV